ncbi:MAG TPA: hypothetical protein VMW75_19260, partial [Thermoanaerobaculia bacterium]|nr:hypothetical protein [Thermoanaerobaculia bacterium]
DLRATGLRTWRFWPPPPPPLSSGAAEDAGIGDLLRRLGALPDGEPRFVGCRGAAHGKVDPVAAAAGFFYAMGDYDLA